MFIKASIISLVVAITATVAQEVQWYNTKSCAGSSSIDDRDVGCNVCVDPAGGAFHPSLVLCMAH